MIAQSLPRCVCRYPGRSKAIGVAALGHADSHVGTTIDEVRFAVLSVAAAGSADHIKFADPRYTLSVAYFIATATFLHRTTLRFDFWAKHESVP